VNPVGKLHPDRIDGLKERVEEGVSKLRGLDIGDQLAVEILSQLVYGRKTTTEITEGIYGLGRSDEGFKSSYTRVGRQIRQLESKGLVSRRLFGNDKPYRRWELEVLSPGELEAILRHPAQALQRPILGRRATPPQSREDAQRGNALETHGQGAEGFLHRSTHLAQTRRGVLQRATH
jgi:DNA-binding HxlR family transcriptional regulator